MTKYGRPVVVAPALRTFAMPGWSIIASACRSASKRAMTCFVSIDRLLLLGEIHRPEPAFADQLQEFVLVDDRAGAFGKRRAQGGVVSHGGRTEKVPRRIVRAKERFHTIAKARIARAGAIQKRAALGRRRPDEGLVEQLLNGWGVWIAHDQRLAGLQDTVRGSGPVRLIRPCPALVSPRRTATPARTPNGARRWRAKCPAHRRPAARSARRSGGV